MSFELSYLSLTVICNSNYYYYCSMSGTMKQNSAYVMLMSSLLELSRHTESNYFIVDLWLRMARMEKD